MSMATTNSSVTHVCGSLFEFNCEAKQEISDLYRVAAGPNVVFEFDNSNYFSIRCPKGDDTSLSLFWEILVKFINAESGKDRDIFEDLRVSRVRGTYADSTTSRSKEIATQTVTKAGVGEAAAQQWEAPSVATEEVSPIYPLNDEPHKSGNAYLIEHETISRVHLSDLRREFIGQRSRDHALANIGTLCSCRLVHISPESADVLVKGDSEEDVQKAISKLRVIDKAIMQTLPLVISFPIMEGRLEPMLQMVALRDVEDDRVETTLLSPDSSLASVYPNAQVLVMLQGGEPVAIKQSGTHHISAEISLWNDFHYQSFGTEVDKYTIQAMPKAIRVSVGRLPSSTAQWVQQDNESQHLDPFKPDPFTQEPAANERSERLLTYRTPLELTPAQVKPSTKRSRTAKAAKAATNLITNSTTPSTIQTVAPTAYPVQNQPATPTESRTEALLSFAPATPLGNGDPASKGLRADGNRRRPDKSKTPPIESPFNAPSDSGSPARAIVPARPCNPGWESITGAKGGILIDTGNSNEEEARIDRRTTMGQRKAQKGLAGSSTKLLLDFEAAARQILNLALPYQGPIKLEVGIGRLLTYQSRFTKFKRPFSIADWSSVLPTHHGAAGLERETIFTPRLTTHSPDADAILRIKLARGQSLFVEKPRERMVTYIITCVTRLREQVIIEVSEDGSFKTKSSELLVGALDWHFPLRSWDARLQITMRERLMSNYQQQVQGLVNNMKVTVNDQSVDLSLRTVDQEASHIEFVLSRLVPIASNFFVVLMFVPSSPMQLQNRTTLTSRLPQLSIQSVLLRRSTAHAANNAYRDCILHLAEVQDMSVEQVSENEYHGSIQLSVNLKATAKLWWEVSLTSVKAAMVLKESEEVEFGDMGEWSPQRLVQEGVIKEIFLLAEAVVTRIDSVGRKNKGPKPGTKVRTSPRTSITGGSLGTVTYW